MTEPTASFAPRDHFAHCIQVLGGVTAASRRLDIDERAIRRFVNGERPLTVRLLTDTATALHRLIADAQAAEADILAACAELPNEA